MSKDSGEFYRPSALVFLLVFPPFLAGASLRIYALDHEHQVCPEGGDGCPGIILINLGKPYSPLFQLHVVDDQPAALHVQDLHAVAVAVHKDEGITVTHVHAHAVGHDTAQGVEALAHVRGVRIQEEAVGVA